MVIWWNHTSRISSVHIPLDVCHMTLTWHCGYPHAHWFDMKWADFTGPHLFIHAEFPLKWRTLLFTIEVYHHSVYHNEVNGSSVHTRNEAASKTEIWREANDALAWKRNCHLAFTAGLLKCNRTISEDGLQKWYVSLHSTLDTQTPEAGEPSTCCWIRGATFICRYEINMEQSYLGNLKKKSASRKEMVSSIIQKETVAGEMIFATLHHSVPSNPPTPTTNPHFLKGKIVSRSYRH